MKIFGLRRALLGAFLGLVATASVAGITEVPPDNLKETHAVATAALAALKASDKQAALDGIAKASALAIDSVGIRTSMVMQFMIGQGKKAKSALEKGDTNDAIGHIELVVRKLNTEMDRYKGKMK